MTVPILIAVIGAVSGITGVIVSTLYAHRLVRIQSQLEEQRDISKARLDYDYEALKRLYSVYEPIKFQLVDLIGQALRRISMLSLAPPAAGSVEQAATVYELLAPAALVRMMDRNLTLADMNLVLQVSVEYGLMKAAYRVLADSTSVASICSAVPGGPCADICDKGLLPYQLDEAADALLGIPATEDNGSHVAERPAKLITFSQFRSILANVDPTQDESGLHVIKKLLDEFTPASRPVFWRSLVIQVLLYGSYLDLVLRDPTTQSDRLHQLAATLLPQIEHALDLGLRLDKFWMSEEHPCQAEVNANAVRDALACATHYYRLRVLPVVDLRIVAPQQHQEAEIDSSP